MSNRPVSSDRASHLALWLLTGLFMLRIAAQPLSFLVPALPAFDSWHGNVMPYPVLLASQLVILTVMIAVNTWVSRGRPSVRSGLARGLTLFGSLYFFGMFVRLIVGLTLDTAPAWFNRPLPSFFHLVLATWILIVARRLSNHAR